MTRTLALLLLAVLLAGCATSPEESDGDAASDQPPADEGLSADFVATDNNSTEETNSTGEGDGTSKA